MKNIESALGDAITNHLPLAGHRVLLAEHRPGWSTWIYCALSGNGIDVVEVVGTAQLERALYQHPRFDAAVIDVALPAVMYGEFVDILRERAPRLPLLFVAPTRELPPASFGRIDARSFVPISDTIVALQRLLLVQN